MGDDTFSVHTDELGLGPEDFPITVEATLIELDGSGVTTLSKRIEKPGVLTVAREDVAGRDVQQTRVLCEGSGRVFEAHEGP